MGVLIAILVLCGVLFIGIFGFLGVLGVRDIEAKTEKFDLEFYKRCQRAGLGNAVKTESEIQKASKIAQKMATEKAFQRKLEKRHLKARWLNARLNNGGLLFAQDARAKKQKKEFEAEKTRMFEALPHGPWSFGSSEYTLEKDCIVKCIVEKGKRIAEPDTYRISNVDRVEVEAEFCLDRCYYQISFSCIGCHVGIIWLDVEGVSSEQVLAIYKYLVKYSAIPEEDKNKLLSARIDFVGLRMEARRRRDQEIKDRYRHPVSYDDSTPSDLDFLSSYGNKGKDASVVGRAVAGTIIAGPVGGVIGALSAVDKNNKNRGK